MKLINHSVYMRFPNGRAKALTLSYDDGVTEDIRLVEILNRYGIKGTFNINSGQYSDGTPSRPERAWGQRMTYAQATELYKNSPHEVALHAHTHPWLEKLSMAQVVYEVMKNREVLEDQFDTVVRGMAYPYGTYSDDVVEALRACGVAYARTTKSTGAFDIPTDWLRMPATCRHASPELFDLADRFLSEKTEYNTHAKLFYLWGHSFEFARDNNWEIIERFCELMGGREDIWYATNMEIYEYVEAFRSLIFSADMRIVQNPTAKTVWFSFDKNLYKIEAGETVILYEMPKL